MGYWSDKRQEGQLVIFVVVVAHELSIVNATIQGSCSSSSSSSMHCHGLGGCRRKSGDLPSIVVYLSRRGSPFLLGFCVVF